MKFSIPGTLKSSRRPAILAVLGGLVIILGGSSAYAAHSSALPGSPLYPLKQLWEEGSLLLSFGPASKAKTHLSIAQDRIQAAQSGPTPAPVLVPTLQTVQQNLSDALNQSNKVGDQSQQKEIRKNISDTASEAEQEAEHENESSDDSSSTDKQDIQSTRDQIKQVKDRASADD